MKKSLLFAFAAVAAFGAKAQLVDPGFEAGPGAYWYEFSTNFGTPLCDATCGLPAYDGTYYAWFGGAAAGTVEEGTLSQDLVIPNGTTGTLTFWFGVGGGDASNDDVFNVLIDGTSLFNASAADTAMYPPYTQVTVDVSAYTDGSSHNLSFVTYQDGGTSILLDLIDLQVDGNSQTAINELINQESAFAVYPNPANDEINLNFNQVEGNATVRIFNAAGSLVHAGQLNNVARKGFKMDVSNFENGVYVIEVNNNGVVSNQRVVVAH